VFVVRPILVPIAAVDPRKLTKSQKQWQKYNEMISNYPFNKKVPGNPIPDRLG